MRNRLEWLLAAVLTSALGSAATAPDVDSVPVDRLEPRAHVSAPGHGHEHGDQRHLGAFEIEKEDTEKAEFDVARLAVVFGLFDHEPRHGVRAPWTIAPLHPIDPIAAHAARGPPIV